MAKLTLIDLGTTLSPSAATVINNNGTLIEAALEKTLSRDGTTPNQMESDIDLNNNDLLNVATITADTVDAGTTTTDLLIIDGVTVVPGELTGVLTATQAEAEAGTDNTKIMTPLRTAQAIDAMAVVPGDIGVTVQAFDTDLTAIAALTSAADKVPYATGAGTWALTDLTAAGRALIDDASASDQRDTLGLGTAAVEDATAFATAAQGALADTSLQPDDIGASVQAFDTDLTAIAALVSVADRVPYATGSGTWALTGLSAAGRALIDDATSGAQRNTLGLGGAAILNVGTTAGTVAAGDDSRIVNAVQTSRTITAGTGLTGGGDLSANRTISLSAGSIASLALADTSLQPADVGRDVGEILQYEDFGGFPTVKTDNRIIFQKPTPTLTDVYNVGVLRNTGALTGGTAGFVNSSFRVDTTVGDVDSFEWGLLSTLTVNGAGAGEHVAGYFQGVKNADNSLWSLCTEIRDFTTNPTTGSLGIEVGLFVTGTDNNSLRHGIDISVGSADNGTGTNIASSGIRISPSLGDPNRAQLKNGIEIKGRATIGLNLSELEPSYSPLAINLASLQRIAFDGNGSGVYTRSLRYETGVLVYETASGQAFTVTDAGVVSALTSVRSKALFINDLAGTLRDLSFQTNGSTRWVVRGSNTAETGSNAGTNFDIIRRDDTGAFLGTPLSITRSTGVITLSHPLSIGATQVISYRDTGWASWTGASNKNAVLDTGTATVGQVAQRVAAIQIALTTHGLLGA